MWENLCKYKPNINFSLIHVLIILFIFQIIYSFPRMKEGSNNNFRGLVSGEDIVKEINEECNDNTNILKYTVVLNSTAFLLNLNKTSRRQLYSSIKELDGKNIGVESGKTYEDTIKTNFPNSKIYYNSTDNLISALLQGEIEAFLLEEPVAKYYASQNANITYFSEKLESDNYGFAFPLNYTKEKRRTQFNEYLSAIKKDGTYNEYLKIWTGEYTSLQKIDKDLTGAEGVIYAGINTKVPPFAYKKNNEILGFEVDLLYRFAKLYKYKVQIIELTTEEQTNYIIRDNIDLVLGCYSITEQRKARMFFSDITYEGGTLVMIRNDNKNKDITTNKKLIVKNQIGVNKYGNILNFPVTGLPNEIERVGSCTFPETLTEIYTFECNIPGLTEDNPMVNGFKYGLITDIIVIDDDITLNSLNSYIPSHILGANVNSEIEHQGTMCPKMNVDLAGVDNVQQLLIAQVYLGFGIYRSSISLPKTEAKLKITKGDESCTAICQESNKISLNYLKILVRYMCFCSFNSDKSSENFVADFESMTFSYTTNSSKKLNMAIKNIKTTKNAMSNLYNNNAKFPDNITNLNTFVVQELKNGHCIGGTFSFNAIGVLYKSISQEQNFETFYPIRTSFVLKVPYDLEEAEILISINAKIRGYLNIRKNYYENSNNKGEYLYLTSNDGVSIFSSACEGNYVDPLYDGNRTYNSTTREEGVVTLSLRDEMSLPKWVIIFFVLLIAALSMAAIHLYIQKLNNETEYVVRYTKNQSQTINIDLPGKQT